MLRMLVPTSEPIDHFTSPQKSPQQKKWWRVCTFGHRGFDSIFSDLTDFYNGRHILICETKELNISRPAKYVQSQTAYDNEGKLYEHAETKTHNSKQCPQKVFRFDATDLLSKWTKPAFNNYYSDSWTFNTTSPLRQSSMSSHN